MIIKEKRDLKHLSWSKTRESSGTAGSYLKSFSYSNGKKVYYKLSYFDDINGAFGYEAINEMIACKIMEYLNIEHLDYYLVNADVVIDGKEYNTFLNYSYDYKKANESKISFENFYKIEKMANETKLDFCKRFGFIDTIYKMFIVDFLINNKDRHGANIEILFDKKKKTYRLAPLFDQGLSFLSPAYKDYDIKEYNVKEIKRANTYIGSSDLEENLKLVPIEMLPTALDIDYVFEEFSDFLNPLYLSKCKELLMDRWDRLECIRNKK